MTIVLKEICKSYDGHPALRKFNISIEWDHCYAFIGPAGSGKSAVLKIFMGTESPDSGEVCRMGDYKYPTLHSAYVSQDTQLNPKKSAIWNVKGAHKWTGKGRATEELLKFLNKDRITIPVSELTSVEERFVEIVKAMLMVSDFLVMDEPFKGMNEKERKAALEYILSQRGSRPLLIASEDATDLEFARIVHMEPVDTTIHNI